MKKAVVSMGHKNNKYKYIGIAVSDIVGACGMLKVGGLVDGHSLVVVLEMTLDDH